MCHAWPNKNDQELSPEIIEKNLLSSSSLNRAEFILEGGEIFAHSRWNDILRLLERRRWALFSRGFYPEETIQACTQFKPTGLRLSMDAKPQSENDETLKNNVITIIRKLSGSATQISISYTISQNNSPEDLDWVKNFAMQNKVNFDLNVYSKLGYLNCTQEEKPIYATDISDEWGFTDAYNNWLTGKIKFPCIGLNYLSTVYPDGKIGLCKKKSDIVLGNINSQNFDQIWNSDATRRAIAQNLDCNECWTKCQRMCDFRIYSKFRRFMPNSFCSKAMKFIVKR